jgi:hypothetical protein
MKKLLYILFLFLAISSNAQQLDSLFLSRNKWRENKYMFQLKVGDTVAFMRPDGQNFRDIKFKPKGKFFLKEYEGYIFICGNTPKWQRWLDKTFARQYKWEREGTWKLVKDGDQTKLLIHNDDIEVRLKLISNQSGTVAFITEYTNAPPYNGGE